MKRYLGISFACFCSFLLLAGIALAKPMKVREPQQMVPEAVEADIVGNVDGTAPTAPSKALADTVWIGDWSFDSGGGCTTAGWTQYDNRIGNAAGDGSASGIDVYGHTVWTEVSTFSGQGLIVGNAAKLGIHNLCWAGDGYDNSWDYGIKLLYRGNTTLDFDFKTDTEACCDFVTVEIDSAAASFSRLNYTTNPGKGPGDYRTAVLMTYSGGPHGNASGNSGAGALHCTASLTDFGVAGTTHAAYIRFAADGGCSHADGAIASAFGAALVVDNVALTGGALTYSENFSGVLNVNVSFENLNPTLAFGTWARMFQHVTDNDKCTENTSCAWLWTDPAFIAVDAAVAYGPGAAVIHNWLDDVIVAPWVSLASTPGATGTVLSFRRFFGNFFTWSKIAQNWSFRSHSKITNVDTTDPTDSLDCYTPWSHAGSWSTGGAAATWGTAFSSATPNIATGAREIQLRWRLSDWQYLAGDTPPSPFRTGPGPFNDRIRIGRLVLNGPVIAEGIDNRSQQQDCFATVPFATGGGNGEHFAPSTDRFGTAAFSMCTDLTINKIGPNVVTGDSISVQVIDGRNAGGITAVTWYGKITSGPHAGKAPAPYAIGGGGVPAGFFAVPGDSCRGASGVVIATRYFVDLDDTYFRGGDSMIFFWAATDASGGFTSDPVGMTATPANQAAAEAATGGLKEVNFLPTITWAPAYLARIAADANGDLDPTVGELAASSQKNCILYDQQVNGDRLTGQINRTSMMYTLDRLGYKDHYDIYDQQAGGNTNNQIGGRATVAQATGYAVMIMDKGRGLGLTLPDGINIDSEKVNQAQWYRDYLANGSLSEILSATLWIVSENTVNEKKTNALIATDMGITLVSNDQGLAANPNVEGQTSFTFAGGGAPTFVGDKFSLAGGCPAIRNYDALGTSGTAVATHKYKAGPALGAGAIVMNKNTSLKWNTVLSAFGWFDIRDLSGNPNGTGGSGGPPYLNPTNPSPEAALMKKILDNTLPTNCKQVENTTGVGDTKLPKITSLFQNEPNPFNPTTKIKFDLARDGQVKLRVFDVAGHQVRTLVNGKLAGARHEVSWNGLDDAGRRVSSGVYFYQLLTDDYSATKKMVVLK